MRPEVDRPERGAHERRHRRHEGVPISEEREDRAVVVDVRGAIEKDDSLSGLHCRIRQSRHDILPAPLAHVRNALDQCGHHASGGRSYPTTCRAALFLLAFDPMSSYAGSLALAPEAREKVLQTFRHTLVLAQEGKNEEALLGCDFMLKMDARFAPARSLLEVLRGVAPGTPVNVERFADYLGIESASEALPDSAHDLREAFPSGPATPVPPAPPVSGLDDLVFGDEEGGAPGSASAPPLASPPSGPPLAQPAPAPAPPRPVSGVEADLRITQFLKQGDEAFARGNAQEAIDLWSRVFLIDLSNEEASRRIDAARESQAEAARKIDLLLTEGVTQYESGDVAGARNKFLDVLAVSEHDATARGYLNQIEAALASAKSAAPVSASAGDSDFMKHEIEAPAPPSFAEDSGLGRGFTGDASSPGLEPAAPGVQKAARPEGKGRIDVRILLAAAAVLLVVVAGGAYWLLRGRPAARPATAGGPPPKGGAPGGRATPLEDQFQKAQVLFDAGKIDEAIAVLVKLPDSDPRHNEALVRIEKMKSRRRRRRGPPLRAPRSSTRCASPASPRCPRAGTSTR